MQEIGPVKTFKQALALFETVGMPARNLAARTRVEYKNDLSDLLKFLEGRGITTIANTLSLGDLEAYLAELEQRGLAPSSRKRKTYSIKAFFRFLHKHGLFDKNIAERLIPPKVPKKERRFLTEREYKALLRACSHHPRDAAIIELFLQTGIRLAELVNLTIDDVELPKKISRDPDNMGFLKVTRKGGDIQTLPLNYKACQALKNWLRVRPKVDHEALFVSKFRNPISRDAVHTLVKKYMREAGIKGASVHSLRHTMATHHIARGTDLKTLQEMLGHADPSTTAIYISLAKKAQRKALQEHAL